MMSVAGSIPLVFLLALPSHAANPLRELQSSRGGAIIEYERATAGEEAFARLSSASPKVVVVADGAPDEAGHEVAAAYAEGLKTLFPGVVVAPSRNDANDADYVAEISVSTDSTLVEGSEMVYSTRQTGVVCKTLADGSVSCNDMGGAPMAVGTRPTKETESKIGVTIRFLHQSDGKRSTVFEDVYSLRIPQNGCRYDISAAATVASTLGKAALSQEPLNIQLYSSPRLLRCDRK